jgi:hypothetical protein
MNMNWIQRNLFYPETKRDGLVKSLPLVMPACPARDLIRHPELIEFTGFWLPPE